MQHEGSLYRIRFSLVDANDVVATSNAKVSFAMLVDATNQTLYSRTFDIKSTDFQTYQLVLTGAPIVAYSWQVDSSEIARPQSVTNNNNQTTSLDNTMKTALLTVTLPNGKTFTTDTTFF